MLGPPLIQNRVFSLATLSIHVGHFVQMDRASVFIRDDQPGKLRRVSELAIRLNRISLGIAVKRASRQIQAAGAKGISHLFQIDLVSRQLGWIGLYADRVLLRPEYLDSRHSVDHRNTPAHHTFRILIELRKRHRFRRYRDIHNGLLRRIDL